MDRMEKRIKFKTPKPKLGRVEALKSGCYTSSKTFFYHYYRNPLLFS